jgi:phosphomannomutase
MKIKFGTDGFRGVIGKDFTFCTALHAGSLAMRYFKNDGKNNMAVGYDTRFLSGDVAAEMAGLAAENGYNSYLSESFCPSPAVSLFIQRKKLNFGLMITASHNSGRFNGVKIKENFGGSALAETIKKISKTSHCPRSAKPGRIRKMDIKSFYLSELSARFKSEKLQKFPLKILINPMFGAASGYMPGLFSGTPIKAMEINNIPSPYFGGVNPEPVEENMEETKKIVLKEKIDIAFAFDGDGDRIACVDNQGAYYSSQRLLPLFLDYLVNVKKEKGLAIKTVSTTSMLDHVAYKNGLKITEVPIGFKNIVPYFLSKKAIVGGEESGGIAIGGYIPERDGIYCAMFLLEIIAHYGKSLSQIWSAMEEKYGQFFFKREDYSFDDENRARSILSAIDVDNVCGRRVKQKNFMDGRKFILSDRSFLLIRVSGTEPVVRVYAEAESQERLSEIFSWTRKFLKKKGVTVQNTGSSSK